MAPKGFRDWTSERLLSTDLEGYTNWQTVMVFASAASRDSNIGANVREGMHAYLEDTDRVTVYNGSAWYPAYFSVPRFGIAGGPGGQSLADGADTALTYAGSSEDYDSDSVVSSGLFTATATTAGYWLFTYGVSFNGDADGYRVAWLQTSAPRRYASSADFTPNLLLATQLTGSAIINVAASSTVQVWGLQNSGGAMTVNASNASSFQGRYLGPA
jgi:hypothetical protein